MKSKTTRFDGLTAGQAARAAKLLQELEHATLADDKLRLDRLDGWVYEAQADYWGPDYGDTTSKCAEPDAFEPFLALSWLIQDLADKEYNIADASAWFRREFPSVSREYWGNLGLDAESAAIAEALTQMNAKDIGLNRIGNF
jgi:hypothetical protein